jgi:hypothetical protein
MERTMIKFLLSQFRRSRLSPSLDDKLQWLRDPLSHPALETMSQRELGDLPFRR